MHLSWIAFRKRQQDAFPDDQQSLLLILYNSKNIMTIKSALGFGLGSPDCKDLLFLLQRYSN